jgi:hypothetical protein
MKRTRRIKKTFCYWHIECCDIDDGKPGTACAAHLAEARVHMCPYNSLIEAKGQSCQDAEPPKRNSK